MTTVERKENRTTGTNVKVYIMVMMTMMMVMIMMVTMMTVMMVMMTMMTVMAMARCLVMMSQSGVVGVKRFFVELFLFDLVLFVYFKYFVLQRLYLSSLQNK